MSKIQSFSSVSVIDLTDVGQINLYLTCNLPTSVIYDPDANNGTGSYTPDWSSSNLIITPVVSYNGTNLSLSSSELNISFTRKEGTNSATALQSGESVTNGVLTVVTNKLAGLSSGQITYICNVTYTNPNSGIAKNIESSMTFTLLSQSPELRSASIVGESVFLYDTNKTLVGSNSITLTADVTNVSISQWQYKKSDGTFVAFPKTYNNSISGTSLIVKANQSSIWVNEKTATIKLLTSDNNVYALHQITKIGDGAPGNSTISSILTNENHVVAVNDDGSIKSSNWASIATTEIRIYEGGEDVTSAWEITIECGSGLTGTYDSTTHVFTPATFTEDESYVNFNCTCSGYSPIIKRYTIAKQYAGSSGQDAIYYLLSPSAYAINLNENGTFTPATLTFNSYMIEGNSDKASYSGRFVIAESTNGTSFTTKYTSSSNESTKTYTPSSSNVSAIKCTLYKAGGTTTELDSQTIIVTSDGITGVSSLSMGLGNYADVIPCNSGKAATAQTITIPFFAYKGIDRIAVSATISGSLPSGVSVKTNTGGTTSADGSIVLTVAKNATFGSTSTLTGNIVINLTADSQTKSFNYSWTKANTGATGASPFLLQLYSEDGGVISSSKTTTTIKTLLMQGTTVRTPTSVTWSYLDPSDSNAGTDGYVVISGQTGTSITIDSEDITGQMYLKCSAVYGSTTSTAYFTIDDVTDPYTSYTYATISQFKNSEGCGAIYTRIYQNGVEVDPIKTTVFSETAPSNPVKNDYYYKLDSTAKTCTLMKYSGSAWVVSTDKDNLEYDYYRLDNKGNSIDSTPYYGADSAHCRCLYVDPSIIDGRMTFVCNVNEASS